MQLLLFLSRHAVISLTWLKIETPKTLLNAERSQRKAISYAVADWAKAKPRIHRLRAFAVNSLWGTLE